MHLSQLFLEDFRNYKRAELAFPDTGITLITGENGQGKSNLLEAIAYVVSSRSFRGANTDALIRLGAERAIVRGQGLRSDRELLIETEIASTGRSRTMLNKQIVRRARDMSEALVGVVFSPDDLVLVKGGPSERRVYIDEVLADSDLRAAALQSDFQRVLKQRNALLRRSGGRSTPEIAATLDVWDSRFADLGEKVGAARESLVAKLIDRVREAYSAIATTDDITTDVGMTMSTGWGETHGGHSLLEQLQRGRSTDLARGVTTVGPHRDDCVLTINGMPARTHSSQGEQRTLALALRLGAHRYLLDRVDAPPILLLDDVFSELDENRAMRLLKALPVAQTFLTTATGAPADSKPATIIMVEKGMAK